MAEPPHILGHPTVTPETAPGQKIDLASSKVLIGRLGAITLPTFPQVQEFLI
jgi:hypothetical protein